MRYILASSSPRRKSLMREISPDFLIEVPDVEEKYPSNLKNEKIVKFLAHLKGFEVSKNHYDDIVISADTIVFVNDELLGKPKDIEDARRMLHILRETPHIVLTGFSIFYQDKEINDYVKSIVIFNHISDDYIEEYLKTDIWKDKAGGYGAQENNKYPLVKEVIGSFDNVIGFPVKEIKEAIDKIKIL